MKLLVLILSIFAVGLCKDNFEVLFEIPDSAIQALTPSNDAYVPCTDEKYMYCQNQFNSFIGYTGSWIDPVSLRHAIYSKYSQGVNGLLNLCHARTQLYLCFGTEYETCTSRIQFIKKGANSTNAYQISGLFNSLDFECSGGIIQATENWPCIYSTWHSDPYNSATTTCLAAFYNNSLNTADQVCLAGQTLAKCFALTFVSAPPPCNVPDLNWWECERILNAFQFDGNCQKIKCTVMGGGSSFVSNYNVESGSDYYKLKAALHRPSHGHEHDKFE
uniref:Uncharacterized protein n=1 Tax=Panagrolaimus sp. JU765 TaxID=591449 RepID=A0AC34PV45_9BILA